MKKRKKFPFFKQLDSKDCGPTCIRILLKHYGKNTSISVLREKVETSKQGSNLYGMSQTLEELGFNTLAARLTLLRLKEAPLPLIIHWNENHYVVLYKIKKDKFYVSDPSYGLLRYSKQEFIRGWIGMEANEGIALLLEPTPKFYEINIESKDGKLSLAYLTVYIFKYKKFVWQLIIGLLAASLLQLIFPFLTQSVVDVGIKNQNLDFVYLVLIAQLMLFLGRTSIEIIRSWILLHLSTRINISLISDFFIKLMNLPISFFDTRMTGDIMQRINDHKRIERIMTTSSLNVLFSVFNILIFGAVLYTYNTYIFLIFLTGTILYFFWIFVFLKKRAELDYKRFSQISQQQSKVIELINGMQTIKLNNAEQNKRWGWESVQAQLYKVSIETLTLEQFQGVGSAFINELKNILITILSAKFVIEGEITLGMMLAISYIVGQLNSPVGQIISFVKELQDAKISLERLSEIHKKDNEESDLHNTVIDFPTNLDLNLNSITFRYPSTEKSVFENLNLCIPAKKITAIVGTSGSGKTTLLKLLLRFYQLNKGRINLGAYNLNNLSQKSWREKCGVVMQEDYIFNDTIANNIAVGVHRVDKNRLQYAVEVANIKTFIEELPLSYNTSIGMEGVGLSTGQKQRILIARAVYKNPDYLFLDEATSALDANNEKTIMEKLENFFHNKTVVVIAHRLSTVKNADQIVVLENGRIVEIGNHSQLIGNKREYYNLVKNQLELGK